jgi:hypothetical protein
MNRLLNWLAALLATRDPIIISFEVLRVVAVLLGLSLVVVTAAGIAARLTRLPSLIRSVDVVTLPSVRRLLDVVIGTTVVVGVMTPTWVAADPNPQPPPVMVMVNEQQPAAPQPSPTPAVTADAMADTWTIQPGQHLWLVAEQTLRRSKPNPVNTADVVSYWRRLIDANRDRLRDPSNPSLVYPGQVIELPPR